MIADAGKDEVGPLQVLADAKENLERVRVILTERLAAIERERAEIKKALGRVRKPKVPKK